MRLLLILLLLLASGCGGNPSAETRAVTDGRLTLKLQQKGTDSYRLVVCRNDTCQNALLTYDNKEVVFVEGDSSGDQISLRRLDSAKEVTKKSGDSILSDAVSLTVAIVIGAVIGHSIHRLVKFIAKTGHSSSGGFKGGVGDWHTKDDWFRLSSKYSSVNLERILDKKGRYYREVQVYTDGTGKPWMLDSLKRGRAVMVDVNDQPKEVILRNWPSREELPAIGFTVAGGTLATHLYLKHGNRSAMLADRMTADNWQAIFSKDSMVNVKIKKDVRYIVYSLAQTFDLKVNSAAL